MTNCDCTLLPCPNECKLYNANMYVLRKNIEAHKKVCPRRRYECPHCQESGEYQERTTTHLEECPKVKIPCPNDGCDEEIEQCNISQHRRRCLYELVSCKYTNIGCMEQVFRKDLEHHQNDSLEHLQLAIDTVHQQEIAINSFKAQQPSTPMKFRITGFDELKKSSKNFYSPGFYTSPGGYKMCIRVCANGDGVGKGTHGTVYAYLMRGENDDHLPWPFTGRVTVELLNQLEDDNHVPRQLIKFPPDSEASKRVVTGERSRTGYGKKRYILHSDLGYNSAKNCQYLKDDCLYFRVKVDAQSTSKPWLV